VRWKDGPLLGFDLETLGTDPMTTLPCSFALVNCQGTKVTKGRYGLIDPGVPIPPEAMKIHGITDEMIAQRGGELDKQILGIAGVLMLASEMRTPVVGMNLRYDLTIIDQHYRRIQGCGLREEGWNGVVIDVSVIDRHVDKYRSGTRKLSDLADHYGVALEKAHNATADAVASVRIAVAIAEKYPEVGHADAEVLHVLQAGWRRAWVTDFNEYRGKHDQEPIPEEEGRWPLATDEEVVV
jgi:DNA polymerase III subunit epsilon